MKSLKIFCIIVTYNGSKWVNKCLGSLVASSVAVQIVVVDNASTDDTVVRIEADFPAIHIIKSGSNLGFGGGNNIGLRMALEQNADFVFLLNQDAFVNSNCIALLVQSFLNEPQIGLVSPVHLNASGDDFDKHFAGYANESDCPGFFSDRFFEREKRFYPITFINAAAWMLSKNTLERVGGFDPLFVHYGEDHDYVERVRHAGLEVGINPLAFIHHDANIVIPEVLSRNAERLKIHHLVQLKKISNTNRSNWLKFLKSEWDQQTTMLLFRKFRDAWFRCKASLSMFKYYKRIKKARYESTKHRAFL